MMSKNLWHLEVLHQVEVEVRIRDTIHALLLHFTS